MQNTQSGISGFGASETGIRHPRNEDRFLVEDTVKGDILLLAVSDGMGGHAAGDLAAEITIDCIAGLRKNTTDWRSSLVNGVRAADEKIQLRGQQEREVEGMGATLTAAALSRTRLWWVNLGDSRLYLFRNNVLKQVSRDHSFVQDFIDAGELTREEAASHPLAHVLDQCVGCQDSDADSGEFALSSGDIILLCTDGVYREVTEKQLCSILPMALKKSPAACVQTLLNICRRSGPPDDCTAAVALVQ